MSLRSVYDFSRFATPSRSLETLFGEFTRNSKRLTYLYRYAMRCFSSTMSSETLASDPWGPTVNSHSPPNYGFEFPPPNRPADSFNDNPQNFPHKDIDSNHGFPETMARRLKRHGMWPPTSVQKKCFPAVFKSTNHDVLARA